MFQTCVFKHPTAFPVYHSPCPNLFETSNVNISQFNTVYCIIYCPSTVFTGASIRAPTPHVCFPHSPLAPPFSQFLFFSHFFQGLSQSYKTRKIRFFSPACRALNQTISSSAALALRTWAKSPICCPLPTCDDDAVVHCVTWGLLIN